MENKTINFLDLQKHIPIESVDFRIQSINRGGYATILAYKDARVDINRLNEVCGILGWKREHTNNNHNCIVSIWDNQNKQWVSKEDTGTESFSEKEKGLASDSFKRACFNLGIGIELYDYPVISIKLNADEFEIKKIKDKTGKEIEKAFATWNLKLNEWIWGAKFENNKLIQLSVKDQNRKIRFTYDLSNNEEQKPIEKQESAGALMVKANKEVEACKTLVELANVWKKYRALQEYENFKLKKDNKKKELSK